MSGGRAARILVEGVSKRYVKYDDTPMLVSRALQLRTTSRRDHHWALRDADFEVAPGETLGVIGQNGSGKSTLLRLLAGVTAPTLGRVAVRGRIAPLISVGVGFHQELTGRENVYVSGTVLGLTRAELDRRFDDIVAFADIEGFVDTPVKFYSSGMFVRLGFAVSVLADPDVLLVDEVLAVGDLAFQLRCFDRMMQIREAGTTIVVVSHNLSAIRRLCDRTLVLHHGDVRHDGPTQEAISLFHDLLGEARDIEDAGAPAPAAGQFDISAVVDGVDLVGPNGQPTRHLTHGDEVRLCLDVTFTRDVADAIVGVAVFNEAGIAAYIDNTDHRELQRFSAGSRVLVEVGFVSRLATGSYTAVVDVRTQTGVGLLGPAPSVSFYVAGRGRVHGVADLEASFTTRPA